MSHPAGQGGTGTAGGVGRENRRGPLAAAKKKEANRSAGKGLPQFSFIPILDRSGLFGTAELPAVLSRTHGGMIVLAEASRAPAAWLILMHVEILVNQKNGKNPPNLYRAAGLWRWAWHAFAAGVDVAGPKIFVKNPTRTD
jgi:hypothetical protein